MDTFIGCRCPFCSSHQKVYGKKGLGNYRIICTLCGRMFLLQVDSRWFGLLKRVVTRVI